MTWLRSGSACAPSSAPGGSWLALTLLAGAAGGLVIALAAGARRADSTVSRWRDATETMDVWVGRSKLWGLEADFARIERLPQVTQSVRSVASRSGVGPL